MTTVDAVRAVLTADSYYEAVAICTEVGLEAMRRLRPESDADEVRSAFQSRWGDEQRRRNRTIKLDTSGKSWTGD